MSPPIQEPVDNPGISLRDWFAAQEHLTDWEQPDVFMSNETAEQLAGRPRPATGNYLDTLKWEAEWRAALRYIRADAMLKAGGHLSTPPTTDSYSAFPFALTETQIVNAVTNLLPGYGGSCNLKSLGYMVSTPPATLREILSKYVASPEDPEAAFIWATSPERQEESSDYSTVIIQVNPARRVV